jgi:streptomycin 6-kinase
MNLLSNGEAGRAWLTALPGVVEDLARHWSLQLEDAYEGGCVAFTAPATREDGTRVVLKVSFIDRETQHEGDALALWNGRGAVRLLDADPKHGALLLEKLDPGTSLHEHPHPDEAIALACGLLKRLRLPLMDGHPFVRVTDELARWGELIAAMDLERRAAAQLDHVLVLEALELCAYLATDPSAPVLVNRDFHLGNVLAAKREPWLVIDPKPPAGEAAFDAGHLIRTLLPQYPDRQNTMRIVRRVAAELDLDPERARTWAFVRSIEDIAWTLSHGQRTDDRQIKIAGALATRC